MLREVWDEIKPGLKTRIKWTLTAVMDTAFLVLWASIQYGANRLLSPLKLSLIDTLVFGVLQVILAVTTLAPILFFIVQEFAIMWVRTRRHIENEQGMIEEKSP